MANPRDTHGRGHPARPHPGQRPAQRRGAGAEPAGLSLSLTRPSPGARGKDEHRHRLQLTGLRAPERPRTHLRHGSAARLGMCRCEVSGRAPGLPAARGSGRGALPSLPPPGWGLARRDLGRGTDGDSPLPAAWGRRWGTRATGRTSTRKTSLGSSTSCWTATTIGSGRDLEVAGKPRPVGEAAGGEGRAAALRLPRAAAARPAAVAGGRRWSPKSGGKAAKLPVPRKPRLLRSVSNALEPGAPLLSQPLSVSRRRRDRSQDGHLRDQLRAGVRRGDGKGPARRPCSVFPGFITVASELTVIKADYEGLISLTISRAQQSSLPRAAYSYFPAAPAGARGTQPQVR